jgi:putative thioredoxin
MPAAAPEGAIKELRELGEFQAAVLDRSAEIPVVVDFWAPWCGPCRVLGPVLEREIAALGGRAELVKINTDQFPEVAMQFGVQGIPAVKAFRNGRVAAEFTGAYPAPYVKDFLARLVPSEGARALEGAEAALGEGRAADAEAALRGLVANAGPADAATADRARLLLARLLIADRRPAEVPSLLASIDARSGAADEIPSIERQLAFFADGKAFGGEAGARAALDQDPKNLEARWALASALGARGAHREALEHLLEIVSRNRKFRDDGARKSMLAIFDQLGGGHELTEEFRRRLQIVL